MNQNYLKTPKTTFEGLDHDDASLHFALPYDHSFGNRSPNDNNQWTASSSRRNACKCDQNRAEFR